MLIFLSALARKALAWYRYHKYALGADLRDGARQALKLVVRANARRDKAPVLLQLREEIEELKVLLRLGQDVNRQPPMAGARPGF